MKNIKSYNDFINVNKLQESLKGAKIDFQAERYINGEISLKQFENYIFVNNEGIGDVVKIIKEKIINTIYTFLFKVINVSKGMLGKFLGFLNSIKSFLNKYPKLTKFIGIAIASVIILVLTSQGVSAAEIDGGTLTSIGPDEIDAAIKWLENSREIYDESATQYINDAIEYLRNFEKGSLEDLNLTKDGIELAKHAIELGKGSLDNLEIEGADEIKSKAETIWKQMELSIDKIEQMVKNFDKDLKIEGGDEIKSRAEAAWKEFEKK